MSERSVLIYERLAAVMAETGAIGKERRSPQQGYQFRGVDDVVAHVQLVMAKHGVVLVPKVLDVVLQAEKATKSGGTMLHLILRISHTFYAPDGSSVEAVTFGESLDSGDKAANKCMSAALKYALTETLLIPTYEAERDTEEHSPEVVKKSRTTKAAPGPSMPPPAAAPDATTPDLWAHYHMALNAQLPCPDACASACRCGNKAERKRLAALDLGIADPRQFRGKFLSLSPVTQRQLIDARSGRQSAMPTWADDAVAGRDNARPLSREVGEEG